MMIEADSVAAGLWPPSGEDIKTAVTVLTLLFGGGLVTKGVEVLRERRRQSRAVKRVPVGDFLPLAVRSALHYYVEHEVSAIDPAGREGDRATLGPREPLFRLLDRTLYHTDDKQYLLLLGDSGMGKTTALLNYYSHNAKRKDAYPITIFSLRTGGVEAKIESVQDKSNTVLLLDALDEDPTAIADHTARVHQLLSLGQQFRAVVISCRSQFFLSSEEITKDTGVARIHHRALGEPAEYLLMKFYLCPFSMRQIKTYLRKRYPFPMWLQRKNASKVIEHVSDLSARPMLLAYLDDLVRSGTTVANISDAYRAIVEQWLLREKPLVADSSALLQFSKKLAVELYLGRATRGGEQAPASEIVGLAHHWGIPLDRWQLTGRSLLTRDAADQFRFAHRSFLEYLFVVSFLEGDVRCLQALWTDQMLAFFGDAVFPRDVSSSFDPEKFSSNPKFRVGMQAINAGNTPIAARNLVGHLAGRAFRTLAFAVMQYVKIRNAGLRSFVSTIAQPSLVQDIEALLSLVFTTSAGEVPRILLIPVVRHEIEESISVYLDSRKKNSRLLGSAELGALQILPKKLDGGCAEEQVWVDAVTLVTSVAISTIDYGVLFMIQYKTPPGEDVLVHAGLDLIQDWNTGFLGMSKVPSVVFSPTVISAFGTLKR